MSSASFFRYRLAIAGAGLYVLAFLSALVYPLFDHHTFSGVIAVLLVLPWSDHFPGGATILWLIGGALLNAAIIYASLATLSLAFARARRPSKD